MRRAARVDSNHAAIIADIHAQATTLRRSLGQRFRKIEAQSNGRYLLAMLTLVRSANDRAEDRL